MIGVIDTGIVLPGVFNLLESVDDVSKISTLERFTLVKFEYNSTSSKEIIETLDIECLNMKNTQAKNLKLYLKEL